MPQFAPADLARWSGGAWRCAPTAPLTGASINTRTLAVGEVFFALPGVRADGHEFVMDAFARGAAGAVVRAEFAAAHPQLPLLAVADPAVALRDIAAGYRATLPATFVAITGSVGKTTVKEMTADLLATVGATARTQGNFNNDLGLPLSLLAVEPDAKFGVFELGMNHPGELAPLCKLLRPSISIVTMVGPVHFEFFDSVQAIAEEKAAVLRCLPKDGLAILDADGDWFELLHAAAPCRLVTTALMAAADYVARVDAAVPDAFVVNERATGEQAVLQNSLPGAHNVRNALLAVAVARAQSATWEDMRRALAAFQPVGLRWQRSEWRGAAIINDAYNASPPSMAAALKTFAETPVAGQRWLVLGGMRELGTAAEDLHNALGHAAAELPGVRLITVGELGAWIAAGAFEAGMGAEKIVICDHCDAAAAVLREQLSAGDAVLLKASRSEKLERVLQDLKAALPVV
ncbi:MAG: UDP-N-acetylmuramoyl-tripeptide--D-alanyl-D-alanine ligase [Verrucomicrobia bacterium]|nr:MAG: UDP-N-acetylmuramoyl-tripeptide--D-alanyl-D-alanine ligase [Verrucomicrobiota bacterium]